MAYRTLGERCQERDGEVMGAGERALGFGD
jgi:hypothetical protein